MNRILKYAGAATLTAALAFAAVSPSQARDGRNAAAAIGFGAGAIVGAAAASSYNNGYYGNSGYYGNDYAYDPGPGYYAAAPVYQAAPVYEDDYAYAPAASYGYRSRSFNHSQGPGCIQSPGSTNYTSCN